VVNHERYMEEVTRDLEQRLQADRDARIREEKQKKDISRELAETEAQLEDDVDTEVRGTGQDGTGWFHLHDAHLTSVQSINS
jgi:hypothetical protein